MRIVIGSDHGGLSHKNSVGESLKARGVEVVDCGTDSVDSVDYPDFAVKVATAVSKGEADRGVLICGTGIGMSIAANKFPGVRAALVTDNFMAQMAMEHNNANILVLGGRVLDEASAVRMVETWLNSRYEGGRHQRRLDKIAEVEEAVRAGKL